MKQKLKREFCAKKKYFCVFGLTNYVVDQHKIKGLKELIYVQRVSIEKTHEGPLEKPVQIHTH